MSFLVKFKNYTYLKDLQQQQSQLKVENEKLGHIYENLDTTPNPSANTNASTAMNTPIIQSRITSINSTETKTCDSNRSSTSSWLVETVFFLSYLLGT